MVTGHRSVLPRIASEYWKSIRSKLGLHGGATARVLSCGVLLALAACDSEQVTAPTVPTSITIDPPSLSLTALNQEGRLTATVRDENGGLKEEAPVTWTTSDRNIVAVFAALGLVTSRGEGTATITATSCSGNCSATATVTVNQEAASVALSDSTLIFSEAGVTVQLTAKSVDVEGYPVVGDTVTWSSSDVGVATVSSTGLVTSVAPGTADITASSGSASAVASVTVTQWSSISAGVFHTCSKLGEGAYCWGENLSGQLGDAATSSYRSVATHVVGPPNTWQSVSARYDHSCGFAPSGEGYCWGENSRGQIGNGDTTDVSVPTAMTGGGTWGSISAGWYHSCGVAPSGEGYCWGENPEGQLGNGDSIDVWTPTPVGGSHTWASISAGGNFSCGVTTSGEGYCWGYNYWRQLGDGTRTNRLVPTAVSGGHTWASISTGRYHSCGVTTSGDGYCWGYGNYGRLGNGSTAHRSVPTLVSGAHTWASIAAGNRYHTCGVTTSGEGYCWGRNRYGQVGDGATSNRLIPTLISGEHVWESISTGGYHACGLTVGGGAYCWGRDNYGQLGNGLALDSRVPIKIFMPS